MLRGSLGLESRGGSGSLWSGTGCPARCPLHRSARSAPSLVPPHPGPLGIGRRARPMKRRLLPLACSGASRPMAARRARRSLPRVPAPRPRPHATEDLGAPPPGWSEGCGRPAPAPRGFPAVLVLINSQASMGLRQWRGQKAPQAGPPLTGHSIRLLPGYSAPSCCAGNPGSSLRAHVPGPGRPAWTLARSPSPRSCRTCGSDLCLGHRSLPKNPARSV